MNLRPALLALAAASSLCAAPALAGDALLRFDGAIGVDPVAGIANGAPVPNTVLGVAPGGRAWVLRKLRGSVETDGRVSLKGRGLLLAGGDSIGTRATITQVFATLFCGGAAFHSPAAELDLAGDFSIKGRFGTVPPNPCTSPVLLVRNAAGTQAWFAAGIVGDNDDD